MRSTALLRKAALSTREIAPFRCEYKPGPLLEAYEDKEIESYPTAEQLEDELGYNDVDPDYSDPYNKHRQQIPFGEFKLPQIAQDSFVAPCATIVGNVELWHKSSIWYGVTVKAEKRLVRIGYRTNIQDGTVIEEVPEDINPDHDGSAIIGNYVTVGHNCYLRACTIEDKCLVGMGSIMSTGSYMEEGSILGANSVLRPFQRVPHGQVWAGNPARYIRDVSETEAKRIELSSSKYFDTAQEHMEVIAYLEPPMEMYREAREKGYSLGYKEEDEKLLVFPGIRRAFKNLFGAKKKSS